MRRYCISCIIRARSRAVTPEFVVSDIRRGFRAPTLIDRVERGPVFPELGMSGQLHAIGRGDWWRHFFAQLFLRRITNNQCA